MRAAAALLVLALAGCGTGPTGAPNEADPFALALRNSGSVATGARYPAIAASNFNALAQLNFAIAAESIKAADNARQIGRFGNGVLLLAAATYGIASNNGANDDTLRNGLIASLGLSEGLRYWGSQNNVRALLLAADHSTCIGSTAMAQDNPSDADAATLWEAMLTVQTDLRRGLGRKPVSVPALTTGLFADPASGNSTDYNLSVAELRLRAAERAAAADDKSLTRKLFTCISAIRSK